MSALLVLVVAALAPPHTMRRLRLAAARWLTTTFVLIPERPD
jgi:hypothetical protein